jgi:hypothetical protein
LTSHLERTVVSEKMIEDDLNHVEESAAKSTNKLGVGFERCDNKGEKSAPKFVPTSNYHKEEDFPTGGSYTRFEPRHLDDPCFPRHDSCPTSSNGEVQKTVKTSSGHMVKS